LKTALAAIPALLLAASCASAALPDWSLNALPAVEVPAPGEPALVLVRARPRRASRSMRKGRPSAAAPRDPVFVAEPDAWRRLVETAKRLGEVEVIRVAGVDYRFRVIETGTPVANQKCPAGTAVSNTLYVYEGLPEQPGDQLYPARLSAECVADYGAPEALSIDADVDGRILNTDLIRSGSTAASHPSFDSGELRAFLKKLVELFLRLP
jgi:hypothetical protein